MANHADEGGCDWVVSCSFFLFWGSVVRGYSMRGVSVGWIVMLIMMVVESVDDG